MDSERSGVKERLEEELGGLRFAGTERVIRLAHPKSRLARLRAWWNKELEIPLLPACAIVIALTVILVLLPWHSAEPTVDRDGRQRQLIDAAGNIYWKDEYERAVAMNEHNGEG